MIAPPPHRRIATASGSVTYSLRSAWHTSRIASLSTSKHSTNPEEPGGRWQRAQNRDSRLQLPLLRRITTLLAAIRRRSSRIPPLPLPLLPPLTLLGRPLRTQAALHMHRLLHRRKHSRSSPPARRFPSARPSRCRLLRLPPPLCRRPLSPSCLPLALPLLLLQPLPRPPLPCRRLLHRRRRPLARSSMPRGSARDRRESGCAQRRRPSSQMRLARTRLCLLRLLPPASLIASRTQRWPPNNPHLEARSVLTVRSEATLRPQQLPLPPLPPLLRPPVPLPLLLPLLLQLPLLLLFESL